VPLQLVPHAPTSQELIGWVAVVAGSDEVWGEMPLQAADAPFTSLLALLPRTVDGQPEAGSGVAGLRERLIVLISPSKCFNVAALDLAVGIVPDPTLWTAFRQSGTDAAEVTPFGYVAAAACYSHAEAEAWRQRLLAYLRANRDYAFEALTAVPGVRAARPEASYLMWVELPDLGEPAADFFERHGVGVNSAVPFGGTPNCVRLNFGCSRATLALAVGRMVAALEARGKS